MMRLLEEGVVLVCDRYIASSIAYGEAQGLDPAWLADIQRFLPRPDLTILLDIAPETAVRRKSSGRDRYERDLQLLSRVRDSYRRQAGQQGWLALDGERAREAVSADVITAVSTRLARE
jgi:dTMP kinase